MIENEVLRNEVVMVLGSAAHKEIAKICSEIHDSILRMKTKIALECFTWERVWLELQDHAPILVAILTSLLPPTKRRL